METMMGYIEESAAQCRRNIEQASQLVQPAVDLYTKKEYNRILIIASGSSYNGSCLAKYFVEKVLKVRTEVVTSFTFNHYETIFDEKTFVFGAGQSGRSTNTNDALQKARDHGLTAIGLTGNVESVMKEHCDLCLNWGMGIEKIGFVTKGVVTLGLYYMLFAIEAGKAKGLISAEEAAGYYEQLKQACDTMDQTVEKAKVWYAANEAELTDLKRVQILGYGPNHAVALEGALKIAETTGHAATAYEMEEFLHGPSIETNAERTVIIVDSLGQPSDRAVKMYESVHELTSRVYLITNRKIDDPKVLTINHHLDEHFSVLFNVIPFQVISAMGRDKWVNPLDEARKRMNDIMGSKAPKTGNEVGF